MRITTKIEAYQEIDKSICKAEKDIEDWKFFISKAKQQIKNQREHITQMKLLRREVDATPDNTLTNP